MPPLTLRLFGTAALEATGEPLTPAVQGQALAFLGVLACAGDRGLPRDKLLVLFWPEAPAERAAHRLNQLAHSLRRRLGADDPIAGSGDLRLDRKRVCCDVWDFEAALRDGELERAATLYAGPLLDGFHLPDSPEVERWLEGHRSALARAQRETLETLALKAELQGEAHAAAGWWRRLAEQEPLSSRVTMHLMTTLAASGDRAQALAHAQTYQKQVREDLEAEPNPAVLALARQLKTSGPRPMAIGVLPIEALDSGPEVSRFAQGLTEELTSLAAQLPNVRVAARTSLAAMQQEAKDFREAGARLGLSALLEGSLRSSGHRVRLLVRLVDVGDGCQVWAGRFDQDVREEFEGQEALARKVVEAMRRKLLTALQEAPRK